MDEITVDGRVWRLATPITSLNVGHQNQPWSPQLDQIRDNVEKSIRNQMEWMGRNFRGTVTIGHTLTFPAPWYPSGFGEQVKATWVANAPSETEAA